MQFSDRFAMGKEVEDKAAQVKRDHHVDIALDDPLGVITVLMLLDYKITKPDCPWSGFRYWDVPDYVAGYGCPVCKGLNGSHYDVEESKWPQTNTIKEPYVPKWEAPLLIVTGAVAFGLILVYFIIGIFFPEVVQ